MIVLRNKKFSWFNKILKKIDDRVNDRVYPSDKEPIKYASYEEISKISRQHKMALQIEKEAQKYIPEWGECEGEIPIFSVDEIKGYSLGNISLGQDVDWPEYHWTGKYWEEIALHHPHKKVPNLKQDILKNLRHFREEYTYGKGTKRFDEEEIEEVLTYLDHLIDIINRSSL